MRPLLFVFICLAFSAFNDVIAEDYYKRQMTISYKIGHKGRMLVPVQTEHMGEKYFMMDTAAGGTTLYSDVARGAGLQRLFGKQKTIVTATGVIRASLFNAGKLTFGLNSKTRQGLPALMRNKASDVSGVLALDLLLWQVYEVDPKIKKIHIYKYANHFSKKPDWFQLKKGDSRGNAIFVKIEINGVEMEAMVDTGATTTVLNKVAASKVAIAGSMQADKFKKLTGGGGKSTIAQEMIADVSLTAIKGQGRLIKKQKMLVADLPAFTVLNLQKKPMILLGMDVLNQSAFVLDMRHSRLFIKGH